MQDASFLAITVDEYDHYTCPDRDTIGRKHRVHKLWESIENFPTVQCSTVGPFILISFISFLLIYSFIHPPVPNS